MLELELSSHQQEEFNGSSKKYSLYGHIRERFPLYNLVYANQGSFCARLWRRLRLN